MDALSDLLRVVRFSGGLFLESNWRAPWCVRSQIVPRDCGVKPDSGLVAFHYVLDGQVQVRAGNDPPRLAGPGNIIVLSRNDAHLLGSDVKRAPMDARPLIRKAGEEVLAVGCKTPQTNPNGAKLGGVNCLIAVCSARGS